MTDGTDVHSTSCKLGLCMWQRTESNPTEMMSKSDRGGGGELQQQCRFSMERHHLLVDCEFQGLKMNSLCKDIKGHKKVI